MFHPDLVQRFRSTPSPNTTDPSIAAATNGPSLTPNALSRISPAPSANGLSRLTRSKVASLTSSGAWTGPARSEQRRPAMQTQLADIDARLSDDRRTRVGQIRRNAPQRITGTLGHRPVGGEHAKRWDIAAGQLDQHHTAYGLTKGLGPTKGVKLPLGYLHSRALVDSEKRTLEQAIVREHQRTLRHEGPSMGIGR